MKKLIFTILLTAFCSLNLFAQSKITKDEYEIYARVFERYYQNFKPDKSLTRIAILESTIGANLLEKVFTDQRSLEHFYSMLTSPQVTKSVLDELAENFKEVNKNSAKLEKQFPIEYEYSLVTKGEIDALLEEGKKENVEYYKKCRPCTPDSNCPHKYSLCRTDEKCTPCVLNPYSWRPFHRKYPNSVGYYSFSRIGFSKDKKFALVYVTKYRGDKFNLDYFVLNKVNDEWKIHKGFGGGWIKN